LGTKVENLVAQIQSAEELVSLKGNLIYLFDAFMTTTCPFFFPFELLFGLICCILIFYLCSSLFYNLSIFINRLDVAKT
jgi:hypothetical protein